MTLNQFLLFLTLSLLIFLIMHRFFFTAARPDDPRHATAENADRARLATAPVHHSDDAMTTRSIPSRPVPSRDEATRKAESFSVKTVAIVTVLAAVPILFLLYWVNGMQLDWSLERVFAGQDGTGWDGTTLTIIAVALTLSGGLFWWLFAALSGGVGRFVCFVTAVAITMISVWSSFEYYAIKGQEKLSTEIARQKLAGMDQDAVAAAREAWQAALGRQNAAINSRSGFDAGAARGSASDLGYLNRTQRSGYNDEVSAAVTAASQAEAAYRNARNAARASAGDSVSVLAGAGDAVSTWFGWTPEQENRYQSMALALFTSMLPSLIVLGFGWHLKEGEAGKGEGDGASASDAENIEDDRWTQATPKGRGVRQTGHSEAELAAMARDVVNAVPATDGTVSVAKIIDALRDPETGRSIGRGVAAKVQARVERLLDTRDRRVA